MLLLVAAKPFAKVCRGPAGNGPQLRTMQTIQFAPVADKIMLALDCNCRAASHGAINAWEMQIKAWTSLARRYAVTSSLGRDHSKLHAVPPASCLQEP
jgi:hypothetical protein